MAGSAVLGVGFRDWLCVVFSPRFSPSVECRFQSHHDFSKALPGEAKSGEKRKAEKQPNHCSVAAKRGRIQCQRQNRMQNLLESQTVQSSTRQYRNSESGNDENDCVQPNSFPKLKQRKGQKEDGIRARFKYVE